MADSTSILDLLTATLANKEATANELLNAASPAMLFGYRASTSSSTTWGYYGGVMLVDGALTVISNGTVTGLSAIGTHFVEATRAGVVSANTTAYTAGRIPLYRVTVAGGVITSWIDDRAWVQPAHVAQRLALVLAADANRTLNAAEARCQILDITSSVSLTVTRDIVLPLAPQVWIVNNATSGAQSLRFIGASGTGITVANARRAILYSDGTNIVRATPDQA